MEPSWRHLHLRHDDRGVRIEVGPRATAGEDCARGRRGPASTLPRNRLGCSPPRLAIPACIGTISRSSAPRCRFTTRSTAGAATRRKKRTTDQATGLGVDAVVSSSWPASWPTWRSAAFCGRCMVPPSPSAYAWCRKVEVDAIVAEKTEPCASVREFTQSMRQAGAPANGAPWCGGQLYIPHALAPVAAVLLEETWRAGVVALGSVD